MGTYRSTRPGSWHFRNQLHHLSSLLVFEKARENSHPRTACSVLEGDVVAVPLAGGPSLPVVGDISEGKGWPSSDLIWCVYAENFLLLRGERLRFRVRQRIGAKTAFGLCFSILVAGKLWFPRVGQLPLLFVYDIEALVNLRARLGALPLVQAALLSPLFFLVRLKGSGGGR